MGRVEVDKGQEGTSAWVGVCRFRWAFFPAEIQEGMGAEALCTVRDSSSSWSSSSEAWGRVALSASCGWGKGKVAVQGAYREAWGKAVGTCEEAYAGACATLGAWGRGTRVVADNNAGVLAAGTWSAAALKEARPHRAPPLFLLFSYRHHYVSRGLFRASPYLCRICQERSCPCP